MGMAGRENGKKGGAQKRGARRGEGGGVSCGPLMRGRGLGPTAAAVCR